MAKVICSPCQKEFTTDAAYLKHKCSKTGFNPTQAEHFDALTSGRFSMQSKAALARGEARKKAAKK